MKELEAVLERLDTTIDAGQSLINEYDAVSADFGVVERKAASLEAEKIVFDFKPHAKKYSKALSKNDFDVAGVTIQEADGAIDLVRQQYREASHVLGETNSAYEKIKSLKIPGKKFIDQLRSIDKEFEAGNYVDVTRLCLNLVEEMEAKIEGHNKAKPKLSEVENLIARSKEAGLNIEVGENFFKQAGEAFKSGNYESCLELCEDALSETKRANDEYTEASALLEDARLKLSQHADAVVSSALTKCMESMEAALAAEEFKKIASEHKKFVKCNREYTKASNLIQDARLKLSQYVDVIDSSTLSKHVESMEASLAADDFKKVASEYEKFVKSMGKISKDAKPDLGITFDDAGFVRDNVKKVIIYLTNKGTATAGSISFKLLDESFFKLTSVGQLKQLQPGEEKQIRAVIKPVEAGPDLDFNFRISYRNLLDNELLQTDFENEVHVRLPHEAPGVAVQTPTQALDTEIVKFTQWKPKKLPDIDKAKEFVEYLQKHRESYLKYPQNEEILDYLRNNSAKFAFPMAYEIPEEPLEVLDKWRLPENLKGNVVLNDNRKDVLDTILESRFDRNHVILGEPGIGKTSLLFEIFDRIMAKHPAAILSTANIGTAHQELGMPLFYDDLPEATDLLDIIYNEKPEGLVVTARRADWEGLPKDFQDLFLRHTIKEFNKNEMEPVCTSMLKFSGIRYGKTALNRLVDYSEGSPIYVWCLINELSSAQINRLQDDYITENAEKGMHNYIVKLMQRLLMVKGKKEFKPGGKHGLTCLLFLSRHIIEKRCSPRYFWIAGKKLAPFVEEKLNDKYSPDLFNAVQQYVSGRGNNISFPHDTWADVLEGEGRHNPFKATIVQIIDEIEGKAIFKEVKLTAAEEAWALVEDNFRSNPHRNATRYLTMAETLLKNFRISKLKGFDWFPLEELRETAAQYTHIPVGRNVCNLIDNAASRGGTTITIRDSIISRSNLNLGKLDADIDGNVINRSS